MDDKIYGVSEMQAAELAAGKIRKAMAGNLADGLIDELRAAREYIAILEAALAVEHETADAAIDVIMSIAEVVGISESEPDMSRKTLAAVKELVAELRNLYDQQAADSANYKTGIGYT